MSEVMEINLPITNGLEFVDTFRSNKNFEDITCKVKFISKRVWMTDKEVGTFDIVEALDGPETGETYAYRNISALKSTAHFWD